MDFNDYGELVHLVSQLADEIDKAAELGGPLVDASVALASQNIGRSQCYLPPSMEV
jgi:hypothetical protein